MSQVDALSRDDLLRIVTRDRRVKEMLASRLAAVVAENAELMAIVQELQGEPERATTMRPAESNGEGPQSPVAGSEVSSVP